MIKPSPSKLYTPTTDTLRARLTRIERGEQYLRRGTGVFSGSDFTRSPLGSVIGSELSAQAIRPIGNLATRVVEGLFTYIATDTSVTLYWDGSNSSVRFVLRRMDGSTFVVPKGSLAITSLAHGTTYELIPFWPVDGCNVGWVIGEVGSPRVCHTEVSATELALAVREDRERLVETTITVTTNAAGVTTPGPPSGGGGFSSGGAGGGFDRGGRRVVLE